MTIAACYLSPEGVVLGADSTSTFYGAPDRHFNHAQKIFEIGSASTLGLVHWGIGGIGLKSYRTLAAELSDDLSQNPATSVQDVANRWTSMFWHAFQQQLGPLITRYLDLIRISPRSPAEEWEFQRLSRISGGCCIGGRINSNHTAEAYQIVFNLMSQPAAAESIPMGKPVFWGIPNLIERLLYSIDERAFQDILNSGKWTGTPQDLAGVFQPYRLFAPGVLPIRDAIDWIHSSIFITIKAMKFSHLAPVCGGPIEIAVITTDRPFRWVSHKGLGEAIDHHTPSR